MSSLGSSTVISSSQPGQTKVDLEVKASLAASANACSVTSFSASSEAAVSAITSIKSCSSVSSLTSFMSSSSSAVASCLSFINWTKSINESELKRKPEVEKLKSSAYDSF